MEDTGENGGDGRHMGCTLFWSFHGRTGNGAGIATVLGWFAMVRPDDREGRRKGKRNSSSVLLWLVDGAAVRPVRERDTTKKRFKMALIKWRFYKSAIIFGYYGIICYCCNEFVQNGGFCMIMAV
ncbi:hypothetical protein AHAS_Ahas19G0357000 [Arachis hypogaea]